MSRSTAKGSARKVAKQTQAYGTAEARPVATTGAACEAADRKDAGRGCEEERGGFRARGCENGSAARAARRNETIWGKAPQIGLNFRQLPETTSRLKLSREAEIGRIQAEKCLKRSIGRSVKNEEEKSSGDFLRTSDVTTSAC